MAINLIIQPDISPMSMKEFIKKAPNYSIAIDGYVGDESKYHITENKIVVNFNHHEKINRLITLATCQQILLHFRMGMLDCFRNKNGEIEMNVFANDCDEDVCLSYFLLKHIYMTKLTDNPVLNRIVNIEGMLDATSGTYPISKDAPILRELAWVFDPFYKAKANGLLNTKNADIFKGVITDVEHRIMAHITGRGESLPIDTRYEVIGGGSNWKLVDEKGIQARTGMISDGITAFVSVKSIGENNWRYVIGKSTPFINTFDLNKIFTELNTIEGLTDDKWGGADIIGGSPRVQGSGVSPSEMEKIINSLVKK